MAMVVAETTVVGVEVVAISATSVTIEIALMVAITMIIMEVTVDTITPIHTTTIRIEAARQQQTVATMATTKTTTTGTRTVSRWACKVNVDA